MRWRWTEGGLLGLALAMTAVGLLAVQVGRTGQTSLAGLLPGLAAGLALLGLHLVLSWRWPGADELLLPLVAFLTGLGLVVVARLQPALLERQAAWVGLGVLAALGALLLPVDRLRWYKYTWALLGIGLVGATVVFGRDPFGSGARLWLGAGGLYFQPTEILKVLLVLFLAAYLSEKGDLLSRGGSRLGPVPLPPVPHLLPLLLMWGLAVLLLVAQRDLGPAFLLFGVFLGLLYSATARPGYVLLGSLAMVVAAWGVSRFFSVARLRLEVWLDPWHDPTGASYQILQAYAALASGGLFGRGPGRGLPWLIPAAHTDFPYVALAEEWGLAGALAVLALFLLLIGRGLAIARRLADPFARLLAAGLTLALGLQAFIITAGNTGLLPLTGITLPFVSYGGSALVGNFLALGFLWRLSTEVRRG